MFLSGINFTERVESFVIWQQYERSLGLIFTAHAQTWLLLVKILLPAFNSSNMISLQEASYLGNFRAFSVDVFRR